MKAIRKKSSNSSRAPNPADKQDHFHVLFQTMPLGAVFQNRQGRLIDANPAAERILGLTIAQMQGRTSTDPRWKAIHEDGSDFPGETHPAMLALQTGKPVKDVVMGVFNPDLDAYRWININAIPRFAPDDNAPYEVYTTFEDITPRKQAEATLKRFDERFRRNFDNMHEGCILIGFDWKYLYLNEAAARHHHQKQEDLLGCTIFEAYPGIEQTPIFSHYRNCMEERTSQHFEGSLAFPDGTTDWYAFSAYPSAEGIFVLSIDITQRKQAEIELQKSEERYRQLFDASFDALIVLDTDGNFLDVNQAAIKRYGYSRSQFFQTNVHELSAPDLREYVKERLQRTLAEGGHFEWRHQRSDGTELPVEIAATTLTFHGRPAILAAVRDITERKHTAEKIAFQARLLENVTDAVIATDEHFTITSWNPGAEKIYGWKMEEVMGRSSVNLLRPKFTDAGSNNSDENRAGFREVIHRHQDGRQIYIESRISLLYDPNGKINGYVSVNRDITERKQAEEALRASERKFKALYDIAPVGISLLNRERQIVEANSALEKITHVTKEGLLAGNYRHRTYLRHDGTPMPPDEFASTRAMKENRAIYNVQTGIITEQGETIWTEINAAPLNLPEASIVVVTNDITERKHADEELRLSRDRLSELSRHLVELHEREARAIGRELHDQIGQILTALKLTLAIIPQLTPEIATQKLAQSQAFVDDLLARVSALSLELRSPMLDDLGLLPALVWHINHFQEGSGIAVDFKHSGIEGWRFAPQIETTAYRVVQEALTNIARHAQGTRAHIQVRAKDREMEIKVEDNGQGFDLKHGLEQHRGLSGMRERVELVRGLFQIESEPGMGTKLSIQLPIREKNQ